MQALLFQTMMLLFYVPTFIGITKNANISGLLLTTSVIREYLHPSCITLKVNDPRFE